MKTIEIIIFLNLILKAISLEDDTEVKFVFSIFRHGARSPYYLDKGRDIFGNYWGEDKKLTEIGFRQHYILGSIQKEKYKSLLDVSGEFNSNEVLAFSSNKTRAINSLSAFSRGLFTISKILTDEQINLAYPPNSKDLSPFVKNQIYGNKAVGKDTSIGAFHLLEKDAYYGYESNCESIPNYFEEKRSSIEISINNLLAKYPFINSHFKLNLDKYEVYSSGSSQSKRTILWNFADDYICCYYQNLNRNSPFKDEEKELEFIKTLEKYLSDDIIYGSFGDKDGYISRILNSKLMSTLTDYMENTINYDLNLIKKPVEKFLIYSVHDTNLAYMWSYLRYAFKIEPQSIPFASIFNFEVVKQKKIERVRQTYKIRIEYNGEEVYYEDFDKFKNRINEIQINDNDIMYFCGWNESGQSLFVSVISFLALFIIVMIIYLIVQFLNRSKFRLVKSSIDESLNN